MGKKKEKEMRMSVSKGRRLKLQYEETNMESETISKSTGCLKLNTIARRYDIK